tara:strand:- start:749 stop:1366 length:618 start_codon:yes stop_codon:yes gene_type:complete
VAEWISALLRRSGSVREVGAGQALVNLAESWLEQGVRETEGSNAGPDVSWLIHDGGGTPSKRPPWCAYFVSSCCRQVERCGYGVEYVTTGRAVSHWQKASEGARILPDDVWNEDPRGLVMVRTRLSKPVGEAEKARSGISRQGHTGLVVALDLESTPRKVVMVSGNSSGHGHSRVSGSGAVAREVITEGDDAWDRLVGFVRVCDP